MTSRLRFASVPCPVWRPIGSLLVVLCFVMRSLDAALPCLSFFISYIYGFLSLEIFHNYAVLPFPSDDIYK
jgi:hypothetical protein